MSDQQRDELAQIWADSYEREVPVIDAILAAGYSKPRTITTEQESDALPIGSVVLDCNGDTARRFPGGWRTTVVEPDGTAWLSGHMEDADLPATVLHEGGAA